jgi:hypothetical protein
MGRFEWATWARVLDLDPDERIERLWLLLPLLLQGGIEAGRGGLVKRMQRRSRRSRG